MHGTAPPHILFMQLQKTLDAIRRDSVKAIDETSRKKIYGLTERQETAVSQLKQMLESTPGGVTLKAYAERMQMTVPATSQLVDSMVSKGVMERRINPKDRRAICLRLTENGRNIFNDVHARVHAEIDRRAERLTNEELETLASIIEKIAE